MTALHRWNSKRDPAKVTKIRAFLGTAEAVTMSDREVARRFQVHHQMVARLRPKSPLSESSTPQPSAHTDQVDDSSVRRPTEALGASKTTKRRFERLQMKWTAPDGSAVEVRPDPVWPSMFRIHHRGGVSDMVNLTRARDAARSIAGG
jgi:hypothetical protein